MSLTTRCLIAYHQEYLRALRRPPDARLKALMSYCLLAEKLEAEQRAEQARADAILQAGVVLMQAGYLRRVIEAGQQDMARIVADFDNEDADRPALLEQARQVQAATAKAVELLQTLEAAVAPEAVGVV